MITEADYDLPPEEFGEKLAMEWSDAMRAVFADLGISLHSRQRPSIRNRNDSTRPPARRGRVTPVPRNRRDRWGKKEN